MSYQFKINKILKNEKLVKKNRMQQPWMNDRLNDTCFDNVISIISKLKINTIWFSKKQHKLIKIIGLIITNMYLKFSRY